MMTLLLFCVRVGTDDTMTELVEAAENVIPTEAENTGLGETSPEGYVFALVVTEFVCYIFISYPFLALEFGWAIF
jgi:hypothetical protein